MKKRATKILSAFLALLMVVLVLPAGVITVDANEHAEAITETITETTTSSEVDTNTNPTRDKVGYSSARVERVDTAHITNILNFDDYPNEDAYKITNVAGFKKLDALLYDSHTFEGITIYLANDIDFSNVEGFKPISYDIEHVKQVNGSPRYYFAGTLDGQGEAICNLKMNSTEEPLKFDDEGNVDMENGKVELESLVCVGLFGVTGAITINNLVIDQSCEFGYTGTAANPCVAALVARSTGSIKVDNVWNQANISGGRFNGAVSGRPAGKYEIKNMTNSGDIFGAQCVGGFFGFDGAGGVIENCRNTGNIKRVGAGDTFHNCSAGFVARARAGVTFRNCINNGNVEGAANVGAFLGTIHSANILEDCINYGVLTATAKPDSIGIFGRHAEIGGAEVGTCDFKNVQDLSGTKDPTLMYEVLDIDFTEEETHSNYQTIITKKPTHTEEGIKTYICSICNYSYTQAIATIPHEWDDGIITTAPTHSSTGIKTFTCSCGATYTETLPIIPHDWDNGIITTAPTHLTTGVKTYTCSCGATKTETVPKLTEHTYDTYYEYNELQHKSICACGHSIYEDHDWKAAYIMNFKMVYSCVDCNATKSVSIPYLAGDANADGLVNLNDAVLIKMYLANYNYTTGYSPIGVAPGADANEDGVINLNDAVLLALYLANFDYETGMSSVILGHNCNKYYTDATCTAPITCAFCGKTVGEALGHSEVVVAEAVAPTCTETGLTEGKVCTVCGVTTLEQKVVDALGHTEKVIPAVAPTCTETGLTAGKVCTACGVITLEQQVVDACHTEKVIPAVAPTCTETGLTAGKVCTACGIITLEQQVVDACHTEKVIPAVAPTCTETGLTAGKVCTACGVTTLEQEIVDALGHTEKEVPAVAPTCTKTGLTAGKVCTVCGVTTLEQEIVDALGHTEKEVPAVAPTCTETGLTAGKVCTVCGVTTLEQKIVDALGHNDSDADGKCENCGVAVSSLSISIFANIGTLVGTTISWSNDIFTVENHQAASTTAIRTQDYNHFRCYKDSDFAVFTNSGEVITKIVIKGYGEARYKTAIKNSAEAAGYKVTVDGDYYTIMGDNTDSISFSASANQFRLCEVTVYYLPKA